MAYQKCNLDAMKINTKTERDLLRLIKKVQRGALNNAADTTTWLSLQTPCCSPQLWKDEILSTVEFSVNFQIQLTAANGVSQRLTNYLLLNLMADHVI